MLNVEEYLKSNNIEYILHEHPAVYTCEEAEKYCGNVPGLACKNLFLRSKRGRQYFLIILPAKKRADLKKIGEIIGDKMTFASTEDLKEKMGLEPGAVSPFGLLNDEKSEIKTYIDKEINEAELLSFHPNRNTASVELPGEMFHKFLGTIKNENQVVEL